MCARAPEASPGVARSRGFQRPPLHSDRGIRERPQMSRRPSAHAKDRCDAHCSPGCEPALRAESALHNRGMGGQTVQVPWEVLHVARSGQRFVVSLLQPLTPQASPPEDKSPSASAARALLTNMRRLPRCLRREGYVLQAMGREPAAWSSVKSYNDTTTHATHPLLKWTRVLPIDLTSWSLQSQ
jgi:hypothetical protein